MNHPLQCRCGSLKGHVIDPKRVNRCVCYCRDCQAFAHFLGRPDEILDAKGGSEIIQTIPANVIFTQGQETLACVRLTQNGLLRWYASCCNTPIGNNVANFKVSFIGLVHNCVQGAETSLDDTFGPIRNVGQHQEREGRHGTELRRSRLRNVADHGDAGARAARRQLQNTLPSSPSPARPPS